ncbi:hypothetical protein LH440_11440, partial [Laribacter hongkongensis]|nr:hypothetical protein [Laribacter hongkongensis]
MASASSKKDFLAGLAQLAAGYRRQIEAEVDGFDPDPARRLERRQRAQASFRYFAQTYFPHYVKCAPASVHDYLFERFQTVVDNGVGDH